MRAALVVLGTAAAAAAAVRCLLPAVVEVPARDSLPSALLQVSYRTCWSSSPCGRTFPGLGHLVSNSFSRPNT